MLAQIQRGRACGKHVFHGETCFRYSVSLALSTNWVFSSRTPTLWRIFLYPRERTYFYLADTAPNACFVKRFNLKRCEAVVRPTRTRPVQVEAGEAEWIRPRHPLAASLHLLPCQTPLVLDSGSPCYHSETPSTLLLQAALKHIPSANFSSGLAPDPLH